MDNRQFIEDPTKGSITFIQNEIPDLLDGDYQLQTQLTINGEGVSESQSGSMNFSVLGPRFGLSPSEVFGVFPAPNTIGDFSEVLPHVILKRTTLPWERSPIFDNQAFEPPFGQMPWLGLLLIDQMEMDSYGVVTENIPITALDSQVFPSESGDNPEQKVNIINIPVELMSKIYPRCQDLSLLAHVRRSFDDQGKQLPEDSAVIVGNRLPRVGSHTHAFLVSFEGAYTSNGELRSIALAEPTQLPVLYSWSFEVEGENSGTLFSTALSQLSSADLMKRLEDNPASDYTNEAGFLVLPHQLRNGQSTASFYRGPLAVPQTTLSFELPVLSADSLLAYDSSLGMFVAAYAAAWELGRLLALKSKQYSTQLYQWKRKQTLLTKSATQAIEKAHLPIYGKSKKWNNLSQNQYAFFRLNKLEEENLAGGSLQILKEGVTNFNTSNQFGDCLNFDGDTTYVNADTLCTGVNENTSTISLWMRIQHFEQPNLDGSTANLRYIIEYSASSDNKLYNSLVLDGSQLKLMTVNGERNMDGGLIEGKWYHIVLQNSFEPNTLKVIVWVDGEIKIESNVDLSNNLPAYNLLRLGCYDYEGERGHFFGSMANFRIYPQLLTPKEISMVRGADTQAALLYPFLNQLRVLEGIPFNYVIPDEAQFPLESISFSRIDHTWLKCLLDGAFSIGRSSAARLEEDRAILQEIGINSEGEYSAMMIRSATLKSWPDVMIQAYDVYAEDENPISTNPIRIIRKEMLSDNFLFCLFEGIVKTVDISQKPTTLHFGVQKTEGNEYEVTLRNADGNEQGTTPVVFYNEGEDRVISCGETANNIHNALPNEFNTITSAQFAFELIEGVQRVRFTNQNFQ